VIDYYADQGVIRDFQRRRKTQQSPHHNYTSVINKLNQFLLPYSGRPELSISVLVTWSDPMNLRIYCQLNRTNKFKDYVPAVSLSDADRSESKRRPLSIDETSILIFNDADNPTSPTSSCPEREQRIIHYRGGNHPTQ
jgi:hypothetical protein